MPSGDGFAPHILIGDFDTVLLCRRVFVCVGKEGGSHVVCGCCLILYQGIFVCLTSSFRIFSLNPNKIRRRSPSTGLHFCSCQHHSIAAPEFLVGNRAMDGSSSVGHGSSDLASLFGEDDDCASLFGDGDDDVNSLFIEETSSLASSSFTIPQSPDSGSGRLTLPQSPALTLPLGPSLALPQEPASLSQIYPQEAALTLPTPPRGGACASGAHEPDVSISLLQHDCAQRSAEELELELLLERELLEEGEEESSINRAPPDLASHSDSQGRRDHVELAGASIKLGRAALLAGNALPRRIDDWNKDLEFFMTFVRLGK